MDTPIEYYWMLLMLVILAASFLTLSYLPGHITRRVARKNKEDFERGYGWAALEILHKGHDISSYLNNVIDRTQFDVGALSAQLDINHILFKKN